MNKTSNKTTIQKNEFDYFFVLLKNRKTILISCLVFAFVGFIYLFFYPKSYTSKSSFSVSLNDNINTIYGSYSLKTRDPLNYLSALEQNSFRDSVLKKVGVENLKNTRFEIKAKEVRNDPNALGVVYPSKFDFFVYGHKENDLKEVNETALSMFLVNIDKSIHEYMFTQFLSEKKIEIDNLNFNIKIKEKLITELKENLKTGVQIKTDKNSFDELIDDRLLNSLEGSERGLIISMMLNGDKGNEFYQETILSLQQVQLKVLNNNLDRNQLLLAKLMESNEKNELASLFDLPFSRSYFMHSNPELVTNSNSGRYLKLIIALLFLGLFISSSFVLVSSYYKHKYILD